MSERLTGVVCDDRSDVRRSVRGLLSRCGFEVVWETDSVLGLRRLVSDNRPTVAVLTLPIVGMSSLAVVSTLHDESPACALIVLSAFQQLELAALEAGARALVPEDDPHELRTVLHAIAAAGPSGAGRSGATGIDTFTVEPRREQSPAAEAPSPRTAGSGSGT